MKEHGLLLSAPMVRASLRDVDPKWMTRRLVGDRNSEGNFKASQLDLSRAWVDPGLGGGAYLKSFLKPEVAKALDHSADDTIHRLYCRYQIGDRIWFRETAWYDREIIPVLGYRRAFFEGGDMRRENANGGESGQQPYESTAELLDLNSTLQKRPSILMPRWACRIVREITAVRPERVNDISEDDAIAEGCFDEREHDGALPSEVYRHLWYDLNADRSPWERNDWVWVISYKRIEAAP